jgi:hypothetical protein
VAGFSCVGLCAFLGRHLAYRLQRFFGLLPAVGKRDRGADLLQFGVLGTARINPIALIFPVRLCRSTDIVAVASRDLEKASLYAAKYKIERAYGDYEVE